MILQVPAIFEVTLVRKGARNPETWGMADQFPVRCEAPPEEPKSLFERETDWFAISGRVFRRYVVRDVKEFAARTTHDNPFLTQHTTAKLRDLSTVQVREILTSNREAAAAAAQARADQIVIQDNVVYAERTPVFWISADRSVRLVDGDERPPDFDPATAMGPGELETVCSHFGIENPFGSNALGRLAHLDQCEASLVEIANRLLGKGIPDRALEKYTLEHIDAYLAYHAPDFDRSTASEELADLVRLAVSNRPEANFRNPAGALLQDLYNLADRFLGRWSHARAPEAPGDDQNDALTPRMS